MTIDDPIDEATIRALQQYAVGVEALVEAATAAGMPESLVRAAIARSRTEFCTNLAATVIALREAIDDKAAMRH